MKLRQSATVLLLFGVLLTAGCANTIRGVGKDTANAVNATEQAGKDVSKAAQ
jgi:entericidin B